MASSTIASSPVLKSFLLSGPTTLSRDELDDAQRREEADRVREDGRKRFAKEIAARVEGLRDAVKSVKGDIMGKGGAIFLIIDINSYMHRWIDTYIRDCQDDLRCPRFTTELPGSARVGSDIVSARPYMYLVYLFIDLPILLSSLASTVFQNFVAADNASETFAGLKRIHGLMPYFMLKAALKISNPMGMIRGVLDLFMAQPFGGRSLLQRWVPIFLVF